MQKLRLTKTLSFDRDIARLIDKEAQKERRSFTRQVEVMLENVLKRQEPAPEAEKPA